MKKLIETEGYFILDGYVYSGTREEAEESYYGASSEYEMRNGLNFERYCEDRIHQIGRGWARICSVTGLGMNEGWCFAEGEEYAHDQNAADKLAINYGYKNASEAVKEGAAYWSQWLDDEDVSYVEINGIFYNIDEL